MPREVEVKTGEFSDNKFWMLQEDGDEGLYEWKREQLVDTISGEHLVSVRGYSDEFDITTSFGTQTKVKVLFEVIGGPFKGAYFAVMFGDSYGKKSHLGEVFTAGFRRPFSETWATVIDEDGKEKKRFQWESVHGLELYLMVESKPDGKGRGFSNVWYKSARQYDPNAVIVPVNIPKNTAVPSYDPFKTAQKEAATG